MNGVATLPWRSARRCGLKLLVAGLLSVPLPAHPALAEQAQRVTVHGLRIERLSMRDSGTKAVAYFSLRNTGTDPVRLVGAESALALRVELYRTSRSGGVMRSRPVTNGITVPAGATVVFARGGLSLHLADWDVGPRHWAQVPLTLRFADGSELAVSATVRR